mmetsp:Transcript_73809/g.233126  ORF Transcript_73809/g.233126 Transcript_73809/m.233126 type:complete len:227 (-) Transcript_73809:48-728(-)
MRAFVDVNRLDATRDQGQLEPQRHEEAEAQAYNDVHALDAPPSSIGRKDGHLARCYQHQRVALGDGLALALVLGLPQGGNEVAGHDKDHCGYAHDDEPVVEALAVNHQDQANDQRDAGDDALALRVENLVRKKCLDFPDDAQHVLVGDPRWRTGSGGLLGRWRGDRPLQQCRPSKICACCLCQGCGGYGQALTLRNGQCSCGQNCCKQYRLTGPARLRAIIHRLGS